MPVTDFLDRTAGAVALLGTFGALMVLLWVGYAGDLRVDLARLPEPIELAGASDPIGLALRVFASESTTQNRMAAVLASRATAEKGGVGTSLRRTAYATLLVAGTRAHGLPGRFLSVADFGTTDGLPIRGLERAAESTFGVSADSLSLGESLVLLDRALADPGREAESGREAVINRRNGLLHKALGLGLIDAARYEAEVAMPLSLAKDDRPVW